MAYPVLANESDLINRVKSEQDSDALTTLVNHHTGVYFKVVNSYAKVYPHAISRNDLSDDSLLNIYHFVVDYDPARRTKLSTYIHDRTDYLCRGLLKKDRNNPSPTKTYGGSGIMPLTEDRYMTTNGQSVTLMDETDDAQVDVMVDRDTCVDDVLAAAACVCHDRRFLAVLRYRHSDGLSWRQIGAKIGLSHEMARKIYNANLPIVKAHLDQRPVTLASAR